MCRSPIRYAVAALAAFAFAGPVHAEFVRSAQLFDWLGEAVKRGGSFKDSTIALGYVTGVHDGLPAGLVCLPREAGATRTVGRSPCGYGRSAEPGSACHAQYRC